MYLLEALTAHLFTLPIFCLIGGVISSFFIKKLYGMKQINLTLSLSILFLIGLKGGGPLFKNSTANATLLLSALVLWGLCLPFLSFAFLKRFTRIDSTTAAVVAACFGSVSVMTFVAGVNFLESQKTPYQGLVFAAVAIMEIPAILSGLFISKMNVSKNPISLKKSIFEAFFNPTICAIILGMVCGASLEALDKAQITLHLQSAFKPTLYLFLFFMGIRIGQQRAHFKQFSWSLSLFGLYMPMLGASSGILLSYWMNLDVGTGTLIAILGASASYIAVPAAMKLALPAAREAIYLPLSLGITFPFNVLIGIPLYYEAAFQLLKN